MGIMILAKGAAAGPSAGGESTLIIFVLLLFGLMYFFMIRPQSQRRRQAMQLQREVSPGQLVRTTAGMYATVASIDDNDVMLEVAPGVQVRYVRQAIMAVISDSDVDTGADAAEVDADGEADAEESQAEAIGDTGGAAASNGEQAQPARRRRSGG